MELLAVNGIVNHADLRPRARDAGYDNGPAGDAVDEVGCSVDRINDPGEAAGAHLRLILLTDDSVIRERLGERLSNEDLDIAVGFGDEVLMALRFDLERVEPVEIAERQGACLLRDPPRSRVSFGDVLRFHSVLPQPGQGTFSARLAA